MALWHHIASGFLASIELGYGAKIVSKCKIAIALLEP